MTTKTKNILQWIAAGLVGFVFIGSAMSKLFGGEEAIEMAKEIGLNAQNFKLVGIVELISVLLFLLPRTGIIGTLLLAAYMGGAMATHLTHSQSIMAPAVIEAIVWAVAFFRFPELQARLFGNKQ